MMEGISVGDSCNQVKMGFEKTAGYELNIER